MTIKLKVKRNVPLSPSEKPRKHWPFADMKVTDVIDVQNKDDWRDSSRYAHTIAKRNNWKMATKWLKKENVGRIRRTK